MISRRVQGLEFLLIDTDDQSFAEALAESRVHLDVAFGLLNDFVTPEISDRSIQEIERKIEGANFVIVTGGVSFSDYGRCSWIFPAVGKLVQWKGIPVVGMVATNTDVFSGEALAIRENLQQSVDTLFTVSVDNMLGSTERPDPLANNVEIDENSLGLSITSITDLITKPGLIGLDFQDIWTVCEKGGHTVMLMGDGSGENRAVASAINAIFNSGAVLLETAEGVLIHVAGDDTVTLFEIDDVVQTMRGFVNAEADIIFGSTVDNTMDGMMRVTVLATGIDVSSINRASTGTMSEEEFVKEWGEMAKDWDDDEAKLMREWARMAGVCPSTGTPT